MASMKSESEIKGVNSGDRFESDSDSAQDVDDSPDTVYSFSDDEIFDEAEDLIMGKNLNCLQECRTTSNQEDRHRSPGCMLPGGYNPRHRDPSHWYLYLSFPF